MKKHLLCVKYGIWAAASVLMLLTTGVGVLHAQHQTALPESHGTPIQGQEQGRAYVELNATQAQSLRVGTVGTFDFVNQRQAIGTISYASNQTVDVYPSYQGKLLQTFAQLDQRVRRGQPLYTIDSPDLVQAESNLIAAVATLDAADRELAREQHLTGADGISQRQLEQTLANQQSAEGAYRAARQAVLIFGKTASEVDTIARSRHVDPSLIVRSPIDGVVTVFNAPPGMLVQPGNPPAPMSVANTAVKWMLADVGEADLAFYHPGELVTATVPAYTDRIFQGRVQNIGELLDPSTHRVTVRAAIADPQDLLRPGMLASFNIRRRSKVDSLSIPADGVVREPDGTMTAWVTTDDRRFIQRTVEIGLRRDDQVQILSGLQRGEHVVVYDAVFLSNMLQASADD